VSRFSDATREALRAQGWRLADVPEEVGMDAREVAYRPGLMPGSPGKTREECLQLLDQLDRMLPTGARGAIGSAWAYQWLLNDHGSRTGEWLLARCFTWASDSDTRGYPLAVGVFGGPEPVLTTALPERRGRGVGLLPLVVPH
jgi:hypothetical protein